MHLEHARGKSMHAQNLAIKLQQDVCECHVPVLPDVGCIRNTRKTHMKYMQEVSGMRANITLELSCIGKRPSVF